MIIAIVQGKKVSTGVKGKNLREIFGIPCVEYCFIGAEQSKLIDKVVASTDCPYIKEIASKRGHEIIDRPPELCQPDSLTEDNMIYSLAELDKRGYNPDILVLMFANAPAINVKLLDDGIQFMIDNPEWDSAMSVSQYDMFSPARAKRIVDGRLESFVDMKYIPSATSIRDSQGSCYFFDSTIQILRRRCIENVESGPQPWKWVGHKIKPLINDIKTFDIDEKWQWPVIEENIRVLKTRS
jgi:CMP-N-acetylneuraminic acid synthetase